MSFVNHMCINKAPGEGLDCSRSFNKWLRCSPFDHKGLCILMCMDSTGWPSALDAGVFFPSSISENGDTTVPNSQLSLFIPFPYSSKLSKQADTLGTVCCLLKRSEIQNRRLFYQITQVTKVTKCGVWTWLTLKWVSHSLQQSIAPFMYASFFLLTSLPELSGSALMDFSLKAFEVDVFLPCLKKGGQ